MNESILFSEPRMDNHEGFSAVDQPKPGLVMQPTKKTLPPNTMSSNNGGTRNPTTGTLMDPFFRRYEYPMLARRITKPDEASRCCELKESAYCPSFTAKPPTESILATPELTIIHAGESEDESESSNDCSNLSLSIPSPPPYDDMEYYNPSPSPPISPQKFQKEMKELRRRAEEEHGACHVKEGGQFREIHYRAAKEALEWYNCKNGTQFKLLKMVEVDFAAGIVFFITMKAVDDNDPTGSPVTFLAKYYHSVFDSDDEVMKCYPKS